MIYTHLKATDLNVMEICQSRKLDQYFVGISELENGNSCISRRADTATLTGQNGQCVEGEGKTHISRDAY
jgi:hypothetical protein